MTGSQTQSSRTSVSLLRRVIVVAIIASFGVAALGGIIVLLGGEFTQTTGNVLFTTVLVGVFAVVVLCGVAIMERPVRWFGFVTAAVGVLALAVVLWLVWSDFGLFEEIWQLALTLSIGSAVCALISLLLLLAAHDRRAVRTGLAATTGLLLLGYLLTVLPIWNSELGSPEWYWRLAGVVWILAALGALAFPVAALVLRAPAEPAVPSAPVAVAAETEPDAVAGATDLGSRVIAEARAAGSEPGPYLDWLLSLRYAPRPDGEHRSAQAADGGSPSVT